MTRILILTLPLAFCGFSETLNNYANSQASVEVIPGQMSLLVKFPSFSLFMYKNQVAAARFGLFVFIEV